MTLSQDMLVSLSCVGRHSKWIQSHFVTALSKVSRYYAVEWVFTCTYNSNVVNNYKRYMYSSYRATRQCVDNQYVYY